MEQFGQEGEFRFGRPRDQEEKLSYNAKTVQQQLEKMLAGFEMPIFEVKDETLEPGYPTGIKIRRWAGVLEQYLPRYWFEQIKPYLT